MPQLPRTLQQQGRGVRHWSFALEAWLPHHAKRSEPLTQHLRQGLGITADGMNWAREADVRPTAIC